MDNTFLFICCVKTIRTRNRACGLPDPDRSRRETKVPGKFASHSRDVLQHVIRLGAFITDTSAAYANFSGNVPGVPQMSDTERDRIDAGIPRLSDEAKKKLADLELSVVQADLTLQLREHQNAVVGLIKDYLRHVIKIHSDLRAERIARSKEARRLARLDTRPLTEDGPLEKPVIPQWLVDEEDVSLENMSAEELQLFEQENLALQSELIGLSSELNQLEGTVTGVARLQEQLTEKVVEQGLEIDRLAAATVGTTETLKDANEQLRQAIQRNAGLRVYILFFLLVMSFSLLFLDWYNE